MAILTIFYGCLTAVGGARHLWHDELFTYYIAQAPDMARFWQELRLDLNPPLSYLLVRASIHFFGDSAYAVRVPSIVGFYIGSLCYLRFIARRLGVLYGLLAMLVFWSTPLFYYATEARPYGLIVGFFGIAMLAWQQVERSRVAVSILGLTTLAMMTTHFFALFYIGPFLLAEFVRQYRNRKVEWSIWAVLLLPAIFLFIYIPVMSQYQAGLFPGQFQAAPRKILSFFENTLQPASYVLLIGICAAMAVTWRKAFVFDDAVALTPAEIGFTTGLVSLPAVVNIALMRSHGAFFDRYAAPATFAYGLLAAFFLARYTNVSRKAAGIVVGLLLLYVTHVDLITPINDALHKSALVKSPRLSQVDPALPLVAASGLTFLEMDRYGDPSNVARLHYLTDHDLAVRYANATIFEGFGTLKKFFPIRAAVDPYRKFVAAHPHFLVLGTPGYAEDWLLRELVDVGASVRYLGEYPGPYRDSQLYEVSLPGK